MSWLYSRALVAEYSEANCLDGEPFARLNVTNTPQAFSSHDKTTEAWNLSPFGMTCERLTEDRGADVLTWFRAGFHARTLVRSEKGRASTEQKAACGWRWPGSSAKYDRDLCLWKTRQCSLFGGLEEFSGIWPRWGTMRDGEFWERMPPALPTYENEFGSLEKILFATPTAKANQTSASMQKWPGCAAIGTGGPLNPTWVEWLMGWPIGWTDIAASATDKYQQWRRLHGRF